jgi:putative flippase GtrA
VLPAPATRPRTGRPLRALLGELGAFGTVGTVAFAVDVGLFQLLYVSGGVDAVLAKLISTLVSMTLAYVGHRYWSFAHRAPTGIRRSYLLFAIVNTTTLLLGLAIVWCVRYPLDQSSVLVLQAANLFSIGVGTVIRYLSYRRWVFPAAGSPATSA